MKARLNLLFLFVLLFGRQSSYGQASPSDSLYTQILGLDSLVFDAFNKRDTIVFGKYFSQDLEFFHDKGGLTGYATTMDFLRKNKAANSDLKRRLLPGSSEVYPIPGYGALQIGRHEFCHTEMGKSDCGIFKFVNIWKQDGTSWIITRVISYGH